MGRAAARTGADRRGQRADRGGSAGLDLAPQQARPRPRCGAGRRAGTRADPGAQLAAERLRPRGGRCSAGPGRAKRRPMTGTPGWAWAAAVGVILGLLAVDLAMGRGQPTMRRALLVSAGWVAAAIVFGGVLLAWRGGAAGQEYFTAYLVEKALSIDNVFVFALLFQAFAVPAAYQHRVLFAGVLGALVLRAGFIAAGATLLEHLSWAGYVFGGLLIVAALRMARGGVHVDTTHGLITRALRRVMPVSEGYHDGRFLTRLDGRLAATPLLAVLVVIEATDVIFAADSIPAALGVTTDMFLVFTSNAFAVLGLRALYFVLAGAMARFGYLTQGVTALLAFIGVKMLIAGVLHIPAP